MRLSGRVGRLERTAERRPPPPCPGCGAPRGYGPGMRVENLRGELLMPVCGKCGLPVDRSGHAISPQPPGGYRDVLRLDLAPGEVLPV